MMHGVRVRNVRRQDFWYRSGADRFAKVGPIITSGVCLVLRFTTSAHGGKMTAWISCFAIFVFTASADQPPQEQGQRVF